VEGSELGYLGGGDCARDMISSSSFDACSCSFSSISSPTDAPSLASPVPDNVIAECSEAGRNSVRSYARCKGESVCDCRAVCESMNIAVVLIQLSPVWEAVDVQVWAWHRPRLTF